MPRPGRLGRVERCGITACTGTSSHGAPVVRNHSSTSLNNNSSSSNQNSSAPLHLTAPPLPVCPTRQQNVEHWRGILRRLYCREEQLRKIVAGHQRYIARMRPVLQERRGARLFQCGFMSLCLCWLHATYFVCLSALQT